MTLEEFSNGFDTLVSSYRRFKDYDKLEQLDSIEFDEYEKSLYLTLSQQELVVNLYNGKPSFSDAFEGTEENRRYLDALVRTSVCEPSESGNIGMSSNSVFYLLPEDLAFIIYEQVTYYDDSLGCYNGSTASVYPVTHDEYDRIRKNPFRGAGKHRVLRIDSGRNLVELISKYNFRDYMIRYISKPEPIILEDLPEGLSIDNKTKQTECKLTSVLHKVILERAVQMALASKNIHVDNQ